MAVFILRLECCDLESLRFGPEALFLKDGGEGALEGFVMVGREVELEEVVGVEGGVARGVEEEVLGVEVELGLGVGGGLGFGFGRGFGRRGGLGWGRGFG